MNKQAKINQTLCVACGCCLTACHFNAISIFRGIYATVDKEKCIGCSMCAKKCPASVITIEEYN